MKIFVTGATGFIGSTFIKKLLLESDHQIIAFGRNTAEPNKSRLKGISKNCRIIWGDLLGDISGLLEGVDWVVNFAAKTYVDHSIKDVVPFVETNILGAMRLLEEAKRYKVKKFLQVSTDEVYGSIQEGSYVETSPLNPTNPYSDSKAGADCLAISYAHTFGLHTIITRTENNYGEMQHPQKVLPVFIKCALEDIPLPVYGDGSHIRQWLYVEDHCEAILQLLESDKTMPGEIFHVAGRQELSNLELAKIVLGFLCKRLDLIKFIDDKEIRPGHDWRYALNCDKIKERIGWQAQTNLLHGLEKTIKWYFDNQWWLA